MALKESTLLMTSSLEEAKLAAIKKYDWYLGNAMRFKIDSMKKAVDSAKASQKHDRQHGLSDNDPRAIGLQNMLEHVEFMLREYQEAFDELKRVGVL